MDSRRSLVGSVRRCQGKGKERALFKVDEGHNIMNSCGFGVSSNLSTYTSNLVLGWDSRRPSWLGESLIPITSVDRGKIAIDTTWQ